METTINAISSYKLTYQQVFQAKRLIPQDLTVDGQTDSLLFGSESLSIERSMSIVVNQSMEKLRAVVDDARAALGISDDTVLDTSPEATANRIADFALGAFDKWFQNHDGLAADEARQEFADFIGAAIQEGISQARGILSALNALNSDVDTNIDSTWDIIQQRLQDFVDGKS